SEFQLSLRMRALLRLSSWCSPAAPPRRGDRDRGGRVAKALFQVRRDKSAEVTSATLSAADAALARRHRYFRRRLVSRLAAWLGIGSAIVLGLREEGCFVVSNSGVVPNERYRKFGLSAGANEIRNLGLAVYGPRRGRAANRHLARGPELNTGPQPVVLGSPFGSTPEETFVRVGPRVRIRFPPARSLMRTCSTRLRGRARD